MAVCNIFRKKQYLQRIIASVFHQHECIALIKCSRQCEMFIFSCYLLYVLVCRVILNSLILRFCLEILHVTELIDSNFCALYRYKHMQNSVVCFRWTCFVLRFPKDKVKRRAWKLALRRRDFEPSDHTSICSCHFKSEDFDTTGQTTRLKEGAIPSVFIFSDRLRKVSDIGKL